MRIKIGENLPMQIALRLKSFGHEVHTAQQEGLSGCLDQIIWEAPQRDKRFLITQDLDFSDARQFAPGTHQGILLIRMHSPSRINLIKRIGEIFQNEDVGGWGGCFVVATDRKVRVRRPAGA